MNPLQDFIITRGLNETFAMNKLQDHGIISDLCVRAEDVADEDCQKAIDFIKTKQK